MKTLCVICPVYNEEEIIEKFYQELKTVLLTTTADYQPSILFVVDRCQDHTLEILKRLSQTDPCLQILALSSRFGHQMSLLAGMDHCNADVVIMMDSDLQHPPDLIPTMLADYERGYEIVYTVRQDSPEVNF